MDFGNIESPKIIEYFRTIYANATNSLAIGPVSRKYDLKATPSNNTFSIWGIIYTLLFFLAFIPHDKNTSLYNKSMRLNREWICAFTQEKLVQSSNILNELRDIMLELADKAPCGFQQNSYDIYATWTIFAAFLNKFIVDVHVYGKRDRSMEAVCDLVRSLEKKKLRRFQKWTINWAKSGIKGL
mgnify:CR=1 FL=1